MDVGDDKGNSDENLQSKSKLEDFKKDFKEDKEASSQITKTFSRRRAVLRIVLGFFALLLWIFIGVSPTIIFSSSIQEFIGVFSFFVKYPIIFLLVALLNIFLAAIVYVFFDIWWWAGFHLIWSIRWFYGYFKYRTASIEEIIRSMTK
jgi:hypothetical protein